MIERWGKPVRTIDTDDGGKLLYYYFDAQDNPLGELDTYRYRTVKQVFVNSDGKITKIIKKPRLGAFKK